MSKIKIMNKWQLEKQQEQSNNNTIIIPSSTPISPIPIPTSMPSIIPITPTINQINNHQNYHQNHHQNSENDSDDNTIIHSQQDHQHQANTTNNISTKERKGRSTKTNDLLSQCCIDGCNRRGTRLVSSLRQSYQLKQGEHSGRVCEGHYRKDLRSFKKTRTEVQFAREDRRKTRKRKLTTETNSLEETVDGDKVDEQVNFKKQKLSLVDQQQQQQQQQEAKAKAQVSVKTEEEESFSFHGKKVKQEVELDGQQEQDDKEEEEEDHKLVVDQASTSSSDSSIVLDPGHHHHHHQLCGGTAGVSKHNGSFPSVIKEQQQQQQQQQCRVQVMSSSAVGQQQYGS